jgi:hypothetical protein
LFLSLKERPYTRRSGNAQHKNRRAEGKYKLFIHWPGKTAGPEAFRGSAAGRMPGQLFRVSTCPFGDKKAVDSL